MNRTEMCQIMAAILLSARLQMEDIPERLMKGEGHNIMEDIAETAIELENMVRAKLVERLANEEEAHRRGG